MYLIHKRTDWLLQKELLKMDERDYLSSVDTIITSSLDGLFGIDKDVTPSPNKE